MTVGAHMDCEGWGQKHDCSELTQVTKSEETHKCVLEADQYTETWPLEE